MGIEEVINRISGKKCFIYDIIITRDEDVMLADDSGLSDLSVFIKYSTGLLILDLENMRAYHFPKT